MWSWKLFLTAALIGASHITALAGVYNGGTGAPNDPYQIADADDLLELSGAPGDYDKCFVLTADIILDPNNNPAHVFTRAVIAPDTSSSNWYQGTEFTGTFDGAGFVISNLRIDTGGAGNDYLGLFGYIRAGDVRDIGLENVSITGGDNSFSLGGLCGISGGFGNGSSSIIGCYASGSVSGGAGSYNLGGLCGNNYDTISNCYTSGSVSGGDNSYNLGGLCGRNGIIYDNANISNCYASGSVSGGAGSYNLGGLFGYNSGVTSNCYATGNVFGDHSVGGLVGEMSFFTTIDRCYATGSVTGSYDVGGLVAKDKGGDVYLSYWDVESGGIAWSVGGTGKTTAEMQDPNTFLGWCSDVWTIDAGKDYPRLALENASGEPMSSLLTLYGGGSGEPNDPYLIYTDEQLYTVGMDVCNWDKHFRMMADVDMSVYVGGQFNVIGRGRRAGYWPIYPGDLPFTGVFDGNGHVINNFEYTTDANCIGLFGYVGIGGEVRNLGLVNANVGMEAADSVGGLCGWNKGIISDCYVIADIVGSHEVGGLCGYNMGMISDCYASGTVSGVGMGLWPAVIGGLCGYNYGTISNCYASSAVTGVGSSTGYIGGLCGNNSYGTISNCYASGTVSGVGSSTGHIGGLCGENHYGMINNCYASGTVSSFDSVWGYSSRFGGLCGDNNLGTISNCYASGTVSAGDGSSRLGGLCGTNSGTIGYCYTSGYVIAGIGSYRLGGLCGENIYGDYTACFWDIILNPSLADCGYDYTTGTSDVDLGDVFGESTANMQTQATFSAQGWDFAGEIANGSEDIWRICVDGTEYPGLRWEFADNAGFVCPGGLGVSDLQFFAGWWLSDNCAIVDDCEGADMDFSGEVDGFDFGRFSEGWLLGL